jgi:hypothetical protein
MAERVWCVFQKLPGERCPTLSAICASASTAAELVALSQREEESSGARRSEWSVTAWTVLRDEVAQIEDIDHISHVLDPMRDGLADPPDREEAPASDASEH